MKKYDVIVVGSGLGGLISALILAMEGKKVCVLEKNNQYGGNLQTFVRNKTIFDTGVHYIGGLGENENLFKYFKYLDILKGLKLSKLNENGFDFVSFSNQSVNYPYAQGYDNFIEQLLIIFPNEEKALHTYVSKIQEICQAFPLYNLESGPKYSEELLSINIKTFLDELTTNEKLKAVLVGTNFLYAGNLETTPLYVHALSLNSYINSSWRIVNGGSQLSKILIKQLRKYGAELYKHQEVIGFETTNEKIISCSTHSQVYHADLFISNINLKQSLGMVGEQKFGKPFTKRINSLQVVPSVFSVYIVLKPNKIPYFNYNMYHFKDENAVWESYHQKADNWPQMAVITTGISAEDQKFCDSITIMTYMHFEEVEKWENSFNTVSEKHERGLDYEKFKEERISKLLSFIEEKIPNVKDNLVSINVSTPLSYRDYIGSEKGNLYGFEKEAASPMKTFISSKTKVKNFFLTGQNVRMHGILGVTIGAFVTCSEILGKEYLINKVKANVNENV